MSESADMSAVAATVVTDASSVTAVGSLAVPSAAAAANLPVDGVSCMASPAATADVTDTSTKSKTPQTRKARSRIAANFGAFSS